ncbi:hypothetical protein LSH36_364g04071 [Paralvinella palmiformis]|uniref:Uncharacterized protein n=1 Tax=Paralvinella palmiformis TaxID=53620 RepID=A0AAD9JFF6_9ANNE|nr:hypothetical protein LSH36_364g04071 [Paralvinella palmiformis]
MSQRPSEGTPLVNGNGKSSSGPETGLPEDGMRAGCRVMEILRPSICELIGVTIFVFVGTTSATSGNVMSTAAAHGLAIMLLIIAFGHISGGHFNPCVTLGALLTGGISLKGAALHWLAQLIGGILGAALCKGVLSSAVYSGINAGIPDLGAGVGVGQGILCEAVLTLTLVLTVIMTAVDRDDNILAPVAIGLAVLVDISAAANISGAVMNPARSFGPAVVGSSVFLARAWTHQYIYWVGPIIGALVAAGLHRFVVGSPSNRIICTQ